ncbi:MAG: cysteine ABC transporter substrate-binding protein [Treponema sp.]|jgi:polar amino acid transport system substrate-binding protein|nr:cysteine ABC transporter substrate-binding protein [Treponema sp.]
MKKLMVVVLALAMTVSAFASGKKDEKNGLDAIKQAGIIRIGVFSDKDPFGYVDANGEYQGYDVYFARRIAKDLLGDETKVQLVPVEAASRVEYLQSNKVDIILANFTVTPQRAEVVDFALPYMKVALGIVSSDADPITDISQLEGKKLIVDKGTTAEQYFTENYPQIELLKFDQNTEAFNALLDGRGAALAHDNTFLFAWAVQNPGFTTTIESLGSLDTIAPAVRKGNKALLDWLNEEIRSGVGSTFFHDDYKATLLPVYGDTVDPESVVVENGVIK